MPLSAHLTLGWWIEILAVILLVALARDLIARAHDEQPAITRTEAA